MTNTADNCFEWQELCELFCIHEEEVEETERKKILERINKMTDQLGREYIIKKIALNPTY